VPPQLMFSGDFFLEARIELSIQADRIEMSILPHPGMTLEIQSDTMVVS
jgi:hypothetical protein